MSPNHSIADLLARAAKLAAAQGVDGDTFVASAWQAYLDRHPETRMALEDKALRAHLRKLRKLGKIAAA